MKKLFIPYELCLLAKEKGFNEMCLAYYYTDNKELNHFEYIDTERSDWEPNFIVNKEDKNHYVSAPLYQQLVDWFMLKHDLHISIRTDFYPSGINYLCQILTYDGNEEDCYSKTKCTGLYGDNGEYGTYYEALDSALIKAFKLI